jgi:hypothetical protein
LIERSHADRRGEDGGARNNGSTSHRFHRVTPCAAYCGCYVLLNVRDELYWSVIFSDSEMLAQMPRVKSATNARANERRRHHDDILKKLF